MSFKSILAVTALFLYMNTLAQTAPKYTEKEFAKEESDKMLLKKLNLSNQDDAHCLVKNIEIWDVDDNNTTHVKFRKEVKVCFVQKKAHPRMLP